MKWFISSIAHHAGLQNRSKEQIKKILTSLSTAFFLSWPVIRTDVTGILSIQEEFSACGLFMLIWFIPESLMIFINC